MPFNDNTKVGRSLAVQPALFATDFKKVFSRCAGIELTRIKVQIQTS